MLLTTQTSLKTPNPAKTPTPAKSATQEKPAVAERYLRDDQDYGYYRDSFVGSKWSSDGQEFKNSSQMKAAVKEAGSLELTFKRRVPDTDRKRNVFGRLGRALLMTVVTTPLACATAVPVAGFYLGYQEFMNCKYMSKEATSTGVAKFKGNQVLFTPQGADRGFTV